ncbi:hypothetical protein ACLOJK_004236 [Asimina triloba]
MDSNCVWMELARSVKGRCRWVTILAWLGLAAGGVCRRAALDGTRLGLLAVRLLLGGVRLPIEKGRTVLKMLLTGLLQLLRLDAICCWTTIRATGCGHLMLWPIGGGACHGWIEDVDAARRKLLLKLGPELMLRRYAVDSLQLGRIAALLVIVDGWICAAMDVMDAV